ncbi:hypothetical protein G9C85_08975 [Halorubellus sp. JP-L1]|uniref:hypothetical protein n=1 Tax=Halorubellus sp. JP-L1 TaxID=2715753 RepID=UPI00140C15CB|nr:hypothetical protein [Halorubellus sp. JP-L1]NHN41762.1 hypothetical protein [Halorubellus sp. JP-L1]
MTDTATESTGEDEATGSADSVDGAWVAVEVASVVTATVAFALWLDGSQAVAVPGGSLSSFDAGTLFLALGALAAAGKARHRSLDLRAIGHVILAVGFGVVAGFGSVVVGGVLTGATIGIVVAVAGANLVVLDFFR